MARTLSIQYVRRLLVLRSGYQLLRLSGRAAVRTNTKNSSPTTIVFDGMCHLCSASTAWIARRTANKPVRFVPAQSEEGEYALKAAGLDTFDPESFLVIQNGQSLQKSRAVIAILNMVGSVWKIIGWLLNLMPVPIADKIYSWVAANRYKWFGRRNTCFIPR
jgi:predicted DCC family thiol-disulfide oxidoreductase YuxK